MPSIKKHKQVDSITGREMVGTPCTYSYDLYTNQCTLRANGLSYMFTVQRNEASQYHPHFPGMYLTFHKELNLTQLRYWNGKEWERRELNMVNLRTVINRKPENYFWFGLPMQSAGWLQTYIEPTA